MKGIIIDEFRINKFAVNDVKLFAHAREDRYFPSDRLDQSFVRIISCYYPRW